LPSSAFASVFVQDNFVRTGQSESLMAPLTQFGGITTTQQWSGLVEVILSGEAVNNPPTGLHVDPFWAFSPSNPSTIQGTGHRFRLSISGCAAASECGAPDIVLFMIFVDGVGFVDPPDVPSLDPIPLQQVLPLLQSIVPYNGTTHTYRFVIDLGPTPRLLTLGDGDGGVFDNSGQFGVQLFAVSQATPYATFAGRLKAEISSGANDTIQITTRFALGAGNNGINPASENVTIRVGKTSTTIPAGSFSQRKPGNFEFEGVIDSALIKAAIRSDKSGFQFTMTCTGLDLGESELPLLLGVTIGNDTGTVLLNNMRLTGESD
jgi:hypothetical protein